MKKQILIICVLLFSLSTANAQEWLTDFKEAKELAAKEHKKIILVFKGSDWCGPCMKLDKQIFNTEEFKMYAQDNFVMLEANFPKRRKNKLSEAQMTKNALLAEQFNKNGIFPFVVVMDKKGTVLGETSYKKVTPKEYIKVLESL